MYLLLGEIGLRVKANQPDRADNFQYIRVALTILSVLGYLIGAYRKESIMIVLSCITIIVLINLLWVLFHIEPIEG